MSWIAASTTSISSVARRTFAASSVLPRSSSVRSSSGCGRKYSTTAVLPGEVTMTSRLAPACGGLGGDQLDAGRVDDRQQLLGHGLRGRQETGAEAGGGTMAVWKARVGLMVSEPNLMP